MSGIEVDWRQVEEINRLTDDQWLTLLLAVLESGVQRDPLVRSLAQESIFEESAKLDIAKQAIHQAMEAARADYKRLIQAEALEAVRKGVKEGTVRLMDAAKEGHLVAVSTLEAMIQATDEAINGIKNGSAERFFFELRPGVVTVSFGKQKVETRHSLSHARIDEIGGVLRGLLTE